MAKFYALYQKFNTPRLSHLNVIREDTIKAIKKAIRKGDNFKDIVEIIRSDMMYYYWSRCEYEFIVSNWTGATFEDKIDVFEQVEPNIENIARLILLDMRIYEHNDKLYKFRYKEGVKIDNEEDITE